MQDKSFLNSLLDLSFSEFVTTRVIKILYVLLLVASALGALLILLTGLASKTLLGALGGIVGGAIAFAVYVILARIWMELLIVIFRIAENTTKLVGLAESKGQTGPAQD